MWCPKCRIEYREGITVCAECHTPLTEELPVEVDTASARQKIDAYGRMESSQNLSALSEGSHAYVEKQIKYEDMKSTAFSLIFVGGAGLVLLVLVLTDVIPLQFAFYMKCIMGVVMGGLFLVFLIIGMRSGLLLKNLKNDAALERQRKEEAKTWFAAAYTAQSLDEKADVNAADEEEQKYFLRNSCMKQALQEHFPDYEEAFLDYLSEQFYEMLYPDE